MQTYGNTRDVKDQKQMGNEIDYREKEIRRDDKVMKDQEMM
jgi:hypothetical protein